MSDASGCAVRTVRSGKVRSLLAALLMEAGRVVPVHSLKDALWGGEPPVSAHASLHNHVARLRRLLDDPERLRAVPPGYLLRVEQGELDIHVFDAHVTGARAAHTDGDWERTVRECTAALALWRGTPLSGLPADLGGYAFVQRLTEARLLLLEWLYDAQLAVPGGRPDGLVPELTALAAEHPLREAYHRQLMLALHATGRQAEALAVHRDLRARLVEELGIEPGPAVREAHLEVLRGEGGRPSAGSARATGGAVRMAGGSTRAAGGAARDAVDSQRGVDSRGVVGSRGAVGSSGAAGSRPASGSQRGADSRGAVGSSGAAGSHPAWDPQRAPGSQGDPESYRASDSPHALDSQRGGADSHPAPDSHPTAHVPGAAPARHADSSHPEAFDAFDASDATPAPSAAPTPTPPTHTPVKNPLTPRPAQLPPPPAHFTGRARIRDDLLDTLTRPSAVTVVSGMAGVGKSALALHVAHGLRERFPDGQLYVNLHGATPGMTPLTSGQALAALLRDLGTEPRRIPEHPDAAAALLRSLLAPTRTLMVLDDAENAAQLRPLLPAGPGCAVIVTSRSPLTALDGAVRFPLGPLSDEDSAALLRAVSGRDGLDAGHPLVGLTGRLPLALRVVAARLAARSALTPEVLAGQLAATEGRLHHLEYDDLSVRRSLAVAHEALAASDREADRDAAAALGRIGALDLPAYGAPLLARLLGTDERRAEAALDRLVDVALLEETAYGRYAPHDLVRDFARELAHSGQAGDTAEIALRWYAAVAERILTAILEPGLDLDDRCRPTAAQPAGHAADVAVVPHFGSPEDAFAWADRELENLVALAEQYADEAEAAAGPESQLAHLSTLLRLLFPCVHRSGRVAEMEVLGRAALTVARRLGDAAAEAYALGDLAGLHFLTGRHNEALALNDRALEIWQGLGAVTRIRRCLNNRGLLLEGLGRHAESGEALRQSLEYSRQLNDPQGEAVTYSHLGNLYEHTDPRAAIEQHRRSLAIGVEIGAVIVQHSAHCNMGYAHLTLGEPHAALPHFEESLRILGGHGDWHGESQTRLGLVRALRLLGDTGRAGRECAELLSRADARADGYTGALARHQHGLLLREHGRGDEAHAQWRAALSALDGTDEKAVVAELRELLAGRKA
ncbi:BTAD domain-containing putative transcriptional regulator [Streptomyces sp. NPDC096205]|uniref:AfsR/SARP family transcriptional regulator n=1 Tax=Streptomyces sp. NPDC096205 TaxID=3366081 RepID=UPI00381C5F0E